MNKIYTFKYANLFFVSRLRTTSSFDPDISGYKVWYTSSLELRWFSASLTEIRSKHRKHGASFPEATAIARTRNQWKRYAIGAFTRSFSFSRTSFDLVYSYFFPAWKYVYYYITISHHIKWYNNDKESFRQKYTIY